MVARREQKTAQKGNGRSPCFDAGQPGSLGQPSLDRSCPGLARASTNLLPAPLIPISWMGGANAGRDERSEGGGHPLPDTTVPALALRVVGELDRVRLVPPGPAEDRELGDRDVFARGELHLAQALVEDAV